MTDQITGHANPDGSGKGNWHASEQTVGRFRKDGGWDRRYTKAIRQAEPFEEPEKPPSWIGVLGLTVYVLFLGVAVVAAGFIMSAIYEAGR